MKGLDLTEEQLNAAEQFILGRMERRGSSKPSPLMSVANTWSDLVRLVAWYGALRYKAGKEGINSLEKPGDTEIVGRREG